MNILFLDELSFPYGNAFASRARCFCKLFLNLGFRVHVIAAVSNQSIEDPLGVKEFDGYTYQIASTKRNKSWMSFVGNPDFIPCVKKYIDSNKVDLIFSSACHNYYYSLLRISISHKIPYVVEQCEWLDITNFKLGKLDPRYILGNNIRSKGYSKANGIVAISRLLCNYYNNKGIKTIRIPTILDVSNMAYRTEICTDEKIIIVYTGNPGKSKEFLFPIIKAFSSSSLLQAKAQFHIYGPSRKAVIENIGKDNEKLLDSTDKCVYLHGHVPQTDIENIIRQASYQIFLRPDRRSSNAGFPTKLGESLAVGTPVIANLTGDIELYLNNKNGIVLSNTSPDTVRENLEKLCYYDSEVKKEMRVNARLTAESAFDYRVYLSQLAGFLENVASIE